MRKYLAIGLLALTSISASLSAKESSAIERLSRGQNMRPLIVPAGVTTHKDIPYLPDGHPQHNLDLFVPQKATRPLPLLMWIHGGGWAAGDKRRIAAIFLVEHGYALASIDYRLSGDAVFPAQIRDAYSALAWLWAHADDYGFDRNRFIVGGASAGGHLASLMATALNAGVKDFAVPERIRIRAVLNYFGPSDFIAWRGCNGQGVDHDAPDALESKLIGAPVLERPDLAKAASPTTYVDHDDPPFLILHGERDPFVPFTQSRLLASYLKLSGVRGEIVRVAGAGHGGGRFQSPEVKRRILEFLRDVLAH